MKVARDERRVFIGEQFDCRAATPSGAVRFRVQVDSVQGNVLIVKTSRNVATVLTRGQEVIAVFTRPGKAFRFKPKVGELKTSGDALLITFTGSFNVEQYERREYKRGTVKGTLVFSADTSGKRTYNGKIANVSEGGLMFSTMFGGMFGPGSKPVGKRIQFDLKLLSEKFPALTGTVRHAWPHPKLREIVLVNVSFDHLTPGTSSRIMRLLKR
ncbi:PilZ domain-containing protein [bacterium]|nr:PilZ domain-containing protein [bacterium]